MVKQYKTKQQNFKKEKSSKKYKLNNILVNDFKNQIKNYYQY